MAKKVKKVELTAAVEAHNSEMVEVITTIIEAVTAKGQRKKILADEKVIALLNRYDIHIEQ